MVRSRTVLALCDPEPFTVATWMLKSLTTGPRTAPWSAPCTANSVVAINTPYQRMDVAVGKHFIIRQRASGAKWESVVILAGMGVLRLARRGGIAQDDRQMAHSPARNPTTPVYPPPRRTAPCCETSCSAHPAGREWAFSPARIGAFRGHPPEVWPRRRSRDARRRRAQE